MTNLTLTEAIAKVQQRPNRTELEYGFAAEVILNAVASGDLIPRADARQAVAEVFRRAAQEAQDWFYDPENARVTDPRLGEAIIALASADTLAEVQRLRAEIEELNAECDRHCDAAQQADGLRYNAEAEAQRLRGDLDEALELAEERLRGQHRLSNQLNDTVRELNTRLAAADGRVAALTEALEKIEAWRQFPRSGRFWHNEDGTVSDQEMSYIAAFGSNGERDFMRGIARAALATVTPPASTGEGRT